VRQRILLAVVVACLAALVPAGAAHASSRQFTTVEAPFELLNGAPDPALDLLQNLGVTAIRIQMSWASVAPDPNATRAPAFNATDPSAYPAAGWSRYDVAIAGARARGIKVLLTLAGPAPRWATASHRDGITNPSATAFGKFATAAGRRYGSQVSWWSIWNEPNLGKMLGPIKGLASASIYRAMYLKAYAGLRSARVSAPILLGELAPIGNHTARIGTASPLRFLRAMLCLDDSYRKSRTCAAVPAQGFAMHPYTRAVGPRMIPPTQDDVTIGVLSRLVKALDRAAAARALPRRLPVYVTEFGVQSFPDHISGVSLPVQSDFRSLAEYMAYGNPRVASFSQYLLRDDQTLNGATGRFESGLFLFKSNAPKPALLSFRTPLVVIPHGSTRATLWGFVRPAHGIAGHLMVQFADRGHAFQTLGTQSFPGSGYWTRSVPNRKGRAWRVVWATADAVYTGPPTLPR
jgi:Cellulase (glycosyl hydrolase family 5)